ncbi:hypothetical protein BET04_04970 [Caminicella sporogenes]|nr:hypothetical protein BET04_04970 [Caminicella sporogenes]
MLINDLIINALLTIIIMFFIKLPLTYFAKTFMSRFNFYKQVIFSLIIYIFVMYMLFFVIPKTFFMIIPYYNQIKFYISFWTFFSLAQYLTSQLSRR